MIFDFCVNLDKRVLSKVFTATRKSDVNVASNYKFLTACR